MLSYDQTQKMLCRRNKPVCSRLLTSSI